MRSHKVVDTSGLHCPQVLLKAKAQLKTMKAGEILKVISTDPSSVLDFKVFSATQGHALKKKEVKKYARKSDEFIFWIKK